MCEFCYFGENSELIDPLYTNTSHSVSFHLSVGVDQNLWGEMGLTKFHTERWRERPL